MATPSVYQAGLAAISGRTHFKLATVCCCKMLNTVITTRKSDICYRLAGTGQQYSCMIQTDLRQVLMGRNIHYAFKYAAEMERAYITMLRQLLQRNILSKIFQHVVFCIFNRPQVKLF